MYKLSKVGVGMIGAIKKQIFNILTKVLRSNILLLISFTIIAVLFSGLLVYLQLSFFWQDEQNYEMFYHIAFWTPLIDAFVIVFFIIAIKSVYEKELKEKTQELDMYFNVMGDALAIVDVDSKRFLNCNKAFEKLTGYTKDELLKLTIEKIHPQDSLPNIINQFEREADADKVFTIPVLHKNSSLVTMCDIATSNYRTDDRNINVGVFRNITQRLKLEEELKDLNKNLEQRVRDEVELNKQNEQQLIQQSRLAQMGEMISMIAHQWRQPLGAISSTSIDLQMKLELEAFDLEEKKERQKFLDYFNNSLNEINIFVQNLTTTINDFRNFYKPNKESATIKLENVILKSLSIMKASLVNDNIKIIQEYNSEGEIELYDSELIQVILNILKNAQDNFIEKEIKEPYIKISTENRTISICDNGGGIAEDIIEKIFDPYFSTKDEKNGTGLGLYMSKTIIEEHHNGSLIVENRDDGTCFVIELGIISEIHKL